MRASMPRMNPCLRKHARVCPHARANKHTQRLRMQRTAPVEQIRDLRKYAQDISKHAGGAEECSLQYCEDVLSMREGMARV